MEATVSGTPPVTPLVSRRHVDLCRTASAVCPSDAPAPARHQPGRPPCPPEGPPVPTPLHLALEIDGDGAHPAAWRRAAHPPDALLTPRRSRAVAAVAENAGFTLVTLDDDVLPPGPAGAA